MKFISGCTVSFLLLSVFIPKEIEALAPMVMKVLIQLAIGEGWQWADMTHYAKCKTVNAPPQMKCPSEVFGVGINEDQAKLTAKTIYPTMVGKPKCAPYVGECVADNLKKGVVGIVKKIPGIFGK